MEAVSLKSSIPGLGPAPTKDPESAAPAVDFILQLNIQPEVILTGKVGLSRDDTGM